MERLHGDVPERLKRKILGRIAAFERSRFRAKLFVQGSLISCAGALVFVSIRALLDALSTSGIYAFGMLTFSDTAVAVSLWRDLAFSILDSVPFSALTVVAASLFCFALCVRSLARTLRTAPMPVSLQITY